MRVLVVFGTRPEIIRLSEIVRRLEAACELVLVHTGQNYDPRLSDQFLRELDVRPPDLNLGIQANGFGEQAGRILAETDAVLARVAPDRVLILGDTNSGLAAIPAARRGIPVYHLEAGNRCYDDRVPEEINRRLIDHCSTVLLPYTQRSRANLEREGIERERIFVVGNPIREVLDAHEPAIARSTILRDLALAPQAFFLATLHRAENVDQPARLASLMAGLSAAAEAHGRPVVVSVHPRTAQKLEQFGVTPASPHVRLLPPLGFLDFVHLERQARAVLTDSGTVQEECCLFHVPNVTLRDVTERPETIEVGSNVLAGADPPSIVSALALALNLGTTWQPPAEYLEPHVSRAVAKIVLGFRPGA